MSEWLYEKSEDNKYRYILGESGKEPLICIGINPSTAAPNKLDATLRVVKRWPNQLRYDGWIMLNVYPLRATNPKDLKFNEGDDSETWHIENLRQIILCLKQFKPGLTFWAAWGSEIRKEVYLRYFLNDIVSQIFCYKPIWMSIGNWSKKGDPHHPLYLKRDAFVNNDFPVLYYLKNLGMQICKVCGCTDNRACLGGCEWVEKNLCSRCKIKEKNSG